LQLQDVGHSEPHSELDGTGSESSNSSSDIYSNTGNSAHSEFSEWGGIETADDKVSEYQNLPSAIDTSAPGAELSGAIYFPSIPFFN
jgi:hypothetical protein